MAQNLALAGSPAHGQALSLLQNGQVILGRILSADSIQCRCGTLTEGEMQLGTKLPGLLLCAAFTAALTGAQSAPPQAARLVELIAPSTPHLYFLPSLMYAAAPTSLVYTRCVVPSGAAEARCHVRLASFDGTSDRALTDFQSFHPNWSPDGTQITFGAYTTQTVGGGTGQHIWLMDQQGGEQHIVPVGAADQPVFSPDGAQLAYITIGSNFDFGLYRSDVDGSNPVPLSGAAEHVWGARPQWSPSGTDILYYYYVTCCEWNAVRIRSTDGAPPREFPPNDPNHEWRTSIWSPQYSPDGNQVAFTKASGIYVSLADGTQIRQLADLCLSPDPLAWSPDGAYLAVTTEQRDACSAEPGGVFLIQVADGHVDPLAVSLTAWDYNSPAWSPDGAQLAFLAGAANPILDLYVLNIDTARVTQIGHDASDPHWRPVPKP
jgi:Tol biopolymer transport system component